MGSSGPGHIYIIYTHIHIYTSNPKVVVGVLGPKAQGHTNPKNLTPKNPKVVVGVNLHPDAKNVHAAEARAPFLIYTTYKNHVVAYSLSSYPKP